MSDFENQPVIPAGNVYRVARVSGEAGGNQLRKLEARQEVHPVRTPTGRTLLTPADGRTVFEALVNRR